jgi:hypothetical protein
MNLEIDPEDGGDTFLRNLGNPPKKVNGVTIHKTTIHETHVYFDK